MSYIPKRLAFVTKTEAHQVDTYTLNKESDDEDAISNTERSIIGESTLHVHPVYMVDPTNKNTMKSALRWATYNNKPAVIKEYDNIPRSNIKIIDIEHRGNGGRAYKAILNLDDKNYYFDIREDTILDAMFFSGISPGGYLNGEYVFARDGKETKCILVGSEKYKKLIVLTELEELKPIKEKDIKLFYPYIAKNNDVIINLGKQTVELHIGFNYKTQNLCFDFRLTEKISVCNTYLYAYNIKKQVVKEKELFLDDNGNINFKFPKDKIKDDRKKLINNHYEIPYLFWSLDFNNDNDLLKKMSNETINAFDLNLKYPYETDMPVLNILNKYFQPIIRQAWDEFIKNCKKDPDKHPSKKFLLKLNELRK